MSERMFTPTPQQDKVIRHSGSAFITACPGAGKTRVMVERARHLLKSANDGRGIAFLSFTRAAISELEDRLRREALLGSPVFPHFIGTFDSFMWQFVVAPFGIPGVETAPRLIPDIGSRMVRPFSGVPEIPLSCFHPETNEFDQEAARRSKFRAGSTLTCLIARHIQAYRTSARKLRTRFYERGELDFDGARAVTTARLAEVEFARRLSLALSARFREIIVDEAQDCNPADLEVIKWLRDAGIPTKVICDPHQSIFEFRGGVTDQLFAFANTFQDDQLGMSGNFRSNSNICKSIVMLRAVEFRNIVDEPLGEFKNDQTHIYILSYAGKSVPATIGSKFYDLLKESKIDVSSAPVLAATRNSGSNAIGQPVVKTKKDLTLRLAEAVNDFYFSFESGNQLSAIEEMHKIILELEGSLPGKSYHQYLHAHDLKPHDWRPQILHILRALKYDPDIYADADAWHVRAKEILAPYLPEGSPSIAQKLKKNQGIVGVLALAPATCPPAKTIHSVKGMEFPGVCVVTVAATLKGVLDFLEKGAPVEKAETAREIYVAASRAQRLLAIAVPKSQAKRLAKHLQKTGTWVTVVGI